MARDVITRPVVAIPDLYLNCTYYVDADATWEDLLNDAQMLNGEAQDITEHLAADFGVADHEDRIQTSGLLFNASRNLKTAKALTERAFRLVALQQKQGV